jgi:hypothetical protein
VVEFERAPAQVLAASSVLPSGGSVGGAGDPADRRRRAGKLHLTISARRHSVRVRLLLRASTKLPTQ